MKKKNRVRKAQEFQKLIHAGKKYSNGSYVIYCMPKAGEQARIGITLAKKIGHAVDRNRIKRQVRMMCQDLVDFDACPMDCIIIVRFGYKDHDYAANKLYLEKLLSKATML